MQNFENNLHNTSSSSETVHTVSDIFSKSSHFGNSVNQQIENAQDSEKDVNLLSAVSEILARGGTFGDFLGMNSEKLEIIYAIGYNLYESDKYEDAKSIFKALCLFDGTISKFWIALAAAEEQLHEFAEAAENYTKASLTGGLQNPELPFKAAQCFLRLNRTEDAKGALELAAVIGDDDNQDVLEIRNKAIDLLHLIK